MNQALQVSKNCWQCINSRKHLFSGMSEASLDVLDKMKISWSYAPGQTVHSSTKAAGLYCLHQGTLKVHFQRPATEVFSNVVAQGEVYGYDAFFDSEVIPSVAKAKNYSIVCYISLKDYLSLTTEHPLFLNRILNQMYNDLKKNRLRIYSLITKNTFERLSESLLYFKSHFPNEKWTRKELAAWAGTTTENAIRVLSKLAKENIISQERGSIDITDLEKLKIYCSSKKTL